MEEYDIVIIGAGPAGLAAATSVKKQGVERVLILDRNDFIGGILRQCIHDGFGIVRYNSALTGPEYADRILKEAQEYQVEIRTSTTVISISPKRVVTCIDESGLKKIEAKAIILATGCRERTRGAIMTPGTRPAGIFTAGVVQNLVNIKNIMPGRRIIILGSGDIGLIMARRLTLEGAKVLAVLEIMPEPCGLQRNISQCIYDFNIPLLVSHTVTKIIGRRHLEAIEISEVDENLRVIPNTGKVMECDTLILSVGLIPENEVALTAGVSLNEKTNGVLTDEYLQSSIPGIFACGNCRRVLDLADLASRQGSIAGANAASYVLGDKVLLNVDDNYSNFKKGFPREGIVICPLCPNGCELELSDGIVLGNKCKRGDAYLRQELVDPRRTLTTTVKDSNGILYPVKLTDIKKADLRFTVIQLNQGKLHIQ